MKGPLLAATLLLAAACGGTPSAAASPPPSPDAISGVVTVFAAASLTQAFKAEGTAFSERHPNASVQFDFAGSSTLAAQIAQGAPADVFASADMANLQKVVAAQDALGQPVAIAANRLEIVVAPGDPKHVAYLSDLARSDLVVVLCAAAVPCGAYARQALAKAGVKVTPKSEEQDVTAVVGKVELGEADAGIVYSTDVKAGRSKVAGVPIPDAQNVVATYPAVTVKGGANAAGGRAFIDFLLSPTGRQILASYGFSSP